MRIAQYPSDGGIGVFLRTRKKGQKYCESNMLMQPGEGIRWCVPVHKVFKKISQKYINKKINSFLRNTISKLYNAISAPVAATRNALAERLLSVRETVSLLYNRTG